MSPVCLEPMKSLLPIVLVLIAVLAVVLIDPFAPSGGAPGPDAPSGASEDGQQDYEARSSEGAGERSADEGTANLARRESAPDAEVEQIVFRGAVRGPEGNTIEGALVELAIGSESDAKGSEEKGGFGKGLRKESGTGKQAGKGKGSGGGKQSGKGAGKGARKSMTGSSIALGKVSTVKTDALGRYEIAAEPSGEPAWLAVVMVRADGFQVGSEMASLDASALGGEPRVVDFALEAELFVCGRVLGVLAEGAQGTPIEGALVTPWGAGESSETDADGSFELGGFGADDDEVWLNVSAPGYIATWANAQIAEDAEPVEVELLAGASVRGVVVHAGQPVPGAKITAQFGKLSADSVSDEAGRFLLQGLPSGALRIRADHPDFPEARREVLVPNAPGVAEVTLVLDAGRTLRGVVRDPNGEPVAEATVALRRGKDRGATAKSDANGEFELGGLPLDRFTLIGRKENYLPVRDLEILPGQSTVEIELRPAAGIALTVVDAATREPISVFQVLELPADAELEEDDKRLTWGRWGTGMAGEYRSDPPRWEPGAELQLRIRATNYPIVSVPSVTASLDADPAGLVVEVAAGASLRLQLLTDRGLPLEGARVAWTGAPVGKGKMPPTTDASGRVEIGGVGAGSQALRIEHDDWGRLMRRVEVPSGVAIHDETIRLQPLASVSGRVLTLDGRPVPNVPVRLVLTEDGWRSARVVQSNAAGGFRFDRVAPGEYRLARIEADDPSGNGKQLELFARMLTVDGSDPVEADVIAPGSARVRAALSAPVSVPVLVYVRLEPLAEGGGPERWARAQNGSVVFDGLAEGRYALNARFFDEGRATQYAARLEVDLDAESIANVTLLFEEQQDER